MNILRGAPKMFLTPERGALKKLGGAPKLCMLHNQQDGGGGGEGLLKN